MAVNPHAPTVGARPLSVHLPEIHKTALHQITLVRRKKPVRRHVTGFVPGFYMAPLVHSAIQGTRHPAPGLCGHGHGRFTGWSSRHQRKLSCQ